jgi:hypothetical protein
VDRVFGGAVSASGGTSSIHAVAARCVPGCPHALFTAAEQALGGLIRDPRALRQAMQPIA